ncbi:MAG: amidohydrolase family protein [Clostridiales bacterium]|nr:amidohydrolase family protein [Clostridiales bacterium]
MNDIVLRGGRVVDGTGSPAREADVAIRDGIIVEVGPACGPAKRELAAEGLTISPGFIDIHAHADLYLLRNPSTNHRILQGVTAEVAGNCGFSAAPLGEWARDFRQYARPVLGTWPADAQYTGMADYLDALARTPLRHSAGALIGLGALRVAVRGYRPGRLAPSEMDRLIRLARESLDAGALGVSMGLMYVPEAYFETDELIRIASVAAGYGRPVTVHLRGEGALLNPCIDEMIEVARRSGAAVHISHLKAIGRDNWNRALAEAIGRLEAGRDAGLDLTADAYPYTAGSSTLLTLLPPWAVTDGADALADRLSGDADFRRRVADAMRTRSEGWDNLAVTTGWERIFVAAVTDPALEGMVGRSLAQCAVDASLDPADFTLDIVARTRGAVTTVSHHMDPADVDRAIAWPHTCVVSDSLFDDTGCPHPRSYGTFGRLFGEFVRERGVLTLEQAVRKCTAMPAERMGLAGMGVVAQGYCADIVLFDAQTISDRASYREPRHYPGGIRGVIVGGQVALWDGRTEPGCMGRALRARKK